MVEALVGAACLSAMGPDDDMFVALLTTTPTKNYLPNLPTSQSVAKRHLFICPHFIVGWRHAGFGRRHLIIPVDLFFSNNSRFTP